MVVGGLQLLGALRDHGFQLRQILGQAVFGAAPMLDFACHGFELLIGSVDQDTNFIVFMAGRALHLRLPGGPRLAVADLANDPHQGLGQHHVKQPQEDKRQDNAAYKPADQRDFRPVQKPAAKRVGVYVKVQHAHAPLRHVVEIQSLVKGAAGAEKKVAQCPIAPAFRLILHRCEDQIVAVGEFCTGDRR